MLNGLAWLLQSLMTVSQMVGILTGPIAVGCLLVAIASPKRRATSAQWGVILLWPWHLYMWSAGIALCVSALGYWSFAALVALLWIVGVSASWLGIVAAFASGRPVLGSWLLALGICLFGVQLAASWLIAHSPLVLDNAQAEPASSPS